MLAETIFTSFVSKIVNDCMDVTKNKIKEAVRDRKNKHQTIESQMYNVVIDVLNEVLSNRYKNEDFLNDMAERLLKEFQYELVDRKEVIKNTLRNYVNSKDIYDKFIKKLYCILCKKDYEELYSTILLYQHEDVTRQMNKVNQTTQEIKEEVNEVKENVREVKEEVQEIGNKILKDTGQKEEKNVNFHNKKFERSKKQEYIKTWNTSLFLHSNNKKRILTLKEVFIMPDYVIKKSVKNIGLYKNDFLDQVIEKFAEYEKTSTMLITGVPGIGKTTITSWIANKYEKDDRFLILRFREWETEDLEGGLLKAIYNTFNCKRKDMEDKILILDGFDEIKTLNIREKILNDFFADIRDFSNFKCIITSRPIYINPKYFHNYIEIREFDAEKVEKFYKKITGNVLYNKEKLQLNLQILGIPVILYMAIMSNVDISENSTKPELYNRIFSEEGGIFDKFYYEGMQYDYGKQVLRNLENIKKYLGFLQDVAFKMFEENNISLFRKECKVPKLICNGNKISILEFPIKHLFETTEVKIEFIHKSIYEYFVSEYIFNKINCIIDKSKEELADVMGKLFIKGIISKEIFEYLEYKINTSELRSKFDFVKRSFELMIKNGMTFYTKEYYKNVINCEMKVFVNMLEFIHLWDKECYKFKHAIDFYLRINEKDEINLEKFNLQGANLTGVILTGVNLSGAILVDANLVNANLMNAKLNDADMRGINLQGANLSDSDLMNVKLGNSVLRRISFKGADLRRADLSGADVADANFSGALLDENQIKYLEHDYRLRNARVFLEDINCIIGYEEYYNNKY